MSGLALALVLAASLCHATWNYILKKSGGGLGILTLSAILAAAMLTPFAIFVIVFQAFTFKPVHFAIVIGSGMIHTLYFLLLDRAYRSGGDLSIVYPLARATGPLITIVAAALLLGERMSVIALAGALMIGVSAFLLTGNPAKFVDRRARRGAGFALLTGCMIAAYTVWDKSGGGGLPDPARRVRLVRQSVAHHFAGAACAHARTRRRHARLANAAQGSIRHRFPEPAVIHPGAHGDGVHSRELHCPGARGVDSVRGAARHAIAQ